MPVFSLFCEINKQVSQYVYNDAESLNVKTAYKCMDSSTELENEALLHLVREVRRCRGRTNSEDSTSATK